MKKEALIPTLILCFVLLATGVFAQKPCAYYFHGIGCPHCARADVVVDAVKDWADIYHFEIYYNRTNAELLNDYFEAYDVPMNRRGIPALFIGETYLIGDAPIVHNIESTIQKNRRAECPVLEKIDGKGLAGKISPLERLKAISLATIAGAAFVDSINPCAIAVLLILLSGLMVVGDKKQAMKAGLAFTASIYIIYFLFGVGLFSALQYTGLAYYFYKAVGFLAIVIGVLNIKDFCRYGAGGFVMEIPRGWRPRLKRLLQSATSPLGAFLIGFVVCLFELPCTGGPYIFILGLLAEKATRLMAIPILLFYNMIFVLPLILLTLLVFYGYTTVEKATEWKERNIKILHLIAGIIMIVLGIVVLMGLI
jgi:cytochrome c biogenesis protein CcdA